MSAEFELHAETRINMGKSDSRRVRAKANKIPAVVYGANKPNFHIQLDHTAVQRKLQNESFYSHVLALQCDGQSTQVVLKAIQRHPFKPKILHMDFLRISDTEKFTMHVPLHFMNESSSAGLKKGGIFSHLMTSVEVSCLPGDLPEFIEVDVAQLNIDDSIHLSQLKLPKGVTLVDLQQGNDSPVVSLHMARVVEEEAPAAPIVTEVIKEKKKDA
jgi:large subunit ribosomal protein L25